MANSVVNIGQLPNGTAKSVLGVNASGAAVQVPVGSTGQSLVQAADAASALTALGLPSGSAQGFRNRIINGDFRVDQRNTGTSSPAPGNGYTQDRWVCNVSQSSKLTTTRNPSWGIGAPPGFPNFLGITSSSAYTPVASDYFVLQQRIEGFNVADLAFGTSAAKPLVLSFYSCASVAGTYAGSLQNSGATRSFAFGFVISAANVWQKFTISIPGDTAGTWATDNGRSLSLSISMGIGANYKTGSSGNWLASNFASITGAVDLVAISGATFGITGVQLEAGTVATPFELRPIGLELQLCQRYFWRKSSLYEHFGAGSGTAAGQAVGAIAFPVPMRGVPTLSCNSPVSGNFNLMGAGGGALNVTNLVFANASVNSAWWTATVDTAYMSGGQGTFLWSNSATAFISASAEL